MQTQIPHPLGLFELRGSALDFDRDAVSVRFVLVQRGELRGGAWLVQGQPVLFVPAADA